MNRVSWKYRFPKRLWWGLVFILFSSEGYAAGSHHVFDFNARCREAYHNILSFRFEEGRRLLQEEQRVQPRNLLPYFLENYIDFFTLFFNEDPQFLKQHELAWKRRLEQLDAGPQGSPYHRYTRGILHFQQAVLQVKLGNPWTAGFEFRKAYVLIRDNQQLHPDFPLNALYSGAMEVAVGTIPDSYKWLARLLGITGTVGQGMKKIEAFLNGKDTLAQWFKDEALFFYCYLKFYVENDREGVTRFIQGSQWDVRNSHLLAFIAANIHLNNQQSDRAIAYISDRNTSPQYFQTPFWDFEIGNAKMHHLDPDAAFFLERFVRDFQGNYYLKDALQKLSWYYYLRGNLEKAGFYREQVRRRGRTDADADKQALREAEKGEWPDPVLLKARLLNDGGYYGEALQLLHGKKVTDFRKGKDQLEFYYRVARLYDDAGRKEEAVHFYLLAIRQGENQKEYFAARSALQLGVIFEKKGERDGAISWYRRCIGMRGHDFKNSLDQRAKAGLLRCEPR